LVFSNVFKIIMGNCYYQFASHKSFSLLDITKINNGKRREHSLLRLFILEPKKKELFLRPQQM
jgi:hypothetical protein